MTKSADMAMLLDSTSKIPVADLSATGTPSASTFLRGDGSWNAPAGGVTSLAAGNGITVSASTGAVTVSQDIYTGSTSSNSSFPIGSYVMSLDQDALCQDTFMNGSRTLYVSANDYRTRFRSGGGAVTGTALTGTWRSRGQMNGNATFLFQRVA
jgi:hypothetical protein